MPNLKMVMQLVDADKNVLLGEPMQINLELSDDARIQCTEKAECMKKMGEESGAPLTDWMIDNYRNKWIHEALEAGAVGMARIQRFVVITSP